jgi:VWFA-related protein
MRKVGIPLLFCLVAITVGSSRAQNATPPAPESTIRVTTTEVALDIVVRDKKGQQVKNLKPSDVEIYEDGVRQQVLSFRKVPGREEQHREAASKPEPQQAGSTSLPLREVNTVCIVFHNIDPVTRPHAVEVVKEFIKSNLPPETYIGIFNLNETLIPVHEFTKNRDELLQSTLNGKALDFGRASEALLTASPNITTLNAQVNNATHTATVTEDTTGGELNNSVIMGADVSNSTGANRLRGDQVRERSDFANITGMHETDRIIALINQLGPLPGRKSVLLVTTGLTTTGDPDRFQKILNNANAHGITFYALDATEMSAMTDTAQSGKLAVTQMASVSQTQSRMNNSAQVARQGAKQGDDTISAVRTSDTQSSLRQLSEGTGGFLIANTNDFRKSFQQLADNLDAHFEAVYHPTSTKYDGRLRKIEVKLARNDLEAESRTGYFAMPDLKGSGPLTPVEATGLAVLNADPRPHSFDFHIAAFHFQNDGANLRGTLAFELPGMKLGATADPARKIHKFEVSLFALIRDSDGQVVDKYSIDQPYFIQDANLATVRATDQIYTHPVDLPPGHYTVDASVVDREGSQATAATAQIEIPAAPKGVGISSLVVVEHVEAAKAQTDAADPLIFKGKHVIPMVEASVSPAKKSYVYFVVYPDKSNKEKPKIKVQFKTAGQVFAESTADLPAPDATGTIPMFVAAVTRPGNCELQITALQGNESATEHLLYAVAAK